MCTTVHKIDNQQEPRVQYRELYLISGKTTMEENVKKKSTCVCITESLCCTPETNTSL